MELLLATSNRHKIEEFRRLLDHRTVSVRTTAELAVPSLHIDETGATFLDNARLKAVAYSEAYRTPALADDSGICVDLLAGAPGVRSARFGSPELDDLGRLWYLMRCLAGVPSEKRGAHYVCALVLAFPDGAFVEVQASWYGRVASEPRTGNTGFGYDPIFLVPPYNLAVSELTPAMKDRVGHRGKAARRLLSHLGR